MAKNGTRVGIDLEQSSIAGAQVRGRAPRANAVDGGRAGTSRGPRVRGRSSRHRGARRRTQELLEGGRLHRQAVLARGRQSEDRRADHGFPHDRRQGDALRHRVPGAGVNPDPAPGRDPRLSGAVDEHGRGRERQAEGPHRRRPARHDHAVCGGCPQGGSHGRGYRSSGFRADALGGAAGRVRRSGCSRRRRGDGARQHRVRRHQPRRGGQRCAGVHPRHQRRVRGAGRGAHGASGGAARRRRHPASQCGAVRQRRAGRPISSPPPWRRSTRCSTPAAKPLPTKIRRSIDYYHSQEPASRIATLLLSGEGALTRNVCEYLGQLCTSTSGSGNPLQHVLENKTKLPSRTSRRWRPDSPSRSVWRSRTRSRRR